MRRLLYIIGVVIGALYVPLDARDTQKTEYGSHTMTITNKRSTPIWFVMIGRGISLTDPDPDALELRWQKMGKKLTTPLRIDAGKTSREFVLNPQAHFNAGVWYKNPGTVQVTDSLTYVPEPDEFWTPKEISEVMLESPTSNIPVKEWK
jgi:hypothetical protein